MIDADEMPGGAVDSSKAVEVLFEVDPQFAAVCKAMFGAAVEPREAWELLYTAQPVEKMSPDASSLHIARGIKLGRGVLRPQRMRPLKPSEQGVLRKDLAEPDEDAVDVVWAGEFSKTDSDRRQAFGWASVVTVGGEPVIDLQGDWITPDEIEKAAYSYVKGSRVGGTQHARDEHDQAVKAGELIESIVFTDEKYEALAKSMDLDPEVFAEAPRGWWTGFQYDDDATWADIKSGRKTGFSVHGKGKRVPLDEAA
jgi:Putative phage serine protease XkdF